ncbi:hypothetical protein [Burkholderia stagnalis]|nr:hypothetical protein [Burkholderia stagnalis]RQQ59568.1 hypothetical protein DF137_33410 [Burkholderia stagnalis]RQQ80277.1 hypothetical protein DF136_33310 [Burkholderia stagnalis]RQR01379.1 hypothetical protein DF025_34780 [Burkholderia stagnalis]RQR01817.1 hypothetical protein DF021_33825 [Burkholderia stagnalis]RQR10384.1 hypothetical protein DF026_35545 [Burkholderia stagnalis]
MADTTMPATSAETTANETTQDPIHFDTLWSTAQAALTVYAGEPWSARGDADPGVTLLQALTYGVSDMGFRHSLPLTDLLTPAHASVKGAQSLAHDEGVGIFAREFGPEQALTCGPVTLDDYRRAILDLTVDDQDDSTFLFRDVQIAALPQDQSYAYTYDPGKYSFGFVTSGTTPSDRRPVNGRYRLWVTLNPNPNWSEEAVGAIKARLQAFLQRNRNLCEAEITDIVVTTYDLNWLETSRVALELRDDLPAERVETVVAQALWAANATLLPWPTRSTAEAWLARGADAESVYAGPQLQYGWITDLPASRGMTALGKLEQRSVSSSLLTAAMMAAAPDLNQVTWVDQTRTARSLPFEIPADQQLQLWVFPWDGSLLRQSIDEQIIVLKRGQPIRLDFDKITQQWQRLLTQATQATRDKTRQVPYGRYRHPGFYRSAGSWLPPVYGLQQAADQFKNDRHGQQLLRFLRPFEQQVADQGDLLERLPRLLAFDGRDPDAVVWGAADWPKADEDDLAVEQSTVALGDRNESGSTWHALHAVSDAQAHDNEQELAILDYLLGYFGEQRAPRALVAGDPRDTDAIRQQKFRAVQQGFLRQATRLAYDRAAISISKISALQRKLAARLGIGDALFDEALERANAPFPRDPLPFYLIEHQELLPIAPEPKAVTSDWPGGQKMTSATDDKQVLTLTLANPNQAALKTGQLIELQATTKSDKTLEAITAIVIHQVVSEENANPVVVNIDLTEHMRLQHSLSILKDSQTYTWHWQIGQTWLKRLTYEVKYDGRPSQPTAPNERVLTVDAALPIGLAPGQRLAWRPKARWQLLPTQSDLDDEKIKDLPDIVVEVTAVDRVRGTLTVQWVAAIANAHGDKPVDLHTAATSLAWPEQPGLYAWSMPYQDETFSFTLSVVLNRQWLGDQGNAGELNQWIEQIVRDEVPSHLNVQVCWLDQNSFTLFANKYRAWQDNNRPVGDLSYELLRLLGIGERPIDQRAGIGFVQVASDATSSELEKARDAALNNDPNSTKFLQDYQNDQIVYVGDVEKSSPTPRYLN